MTKLDSVMEEINNEPETSTETNNKETSTNTSPKEETSPEVPKNSNTDVPDEKESDKIKYKEDDKPEPDKKDKSQYSDMEKAEYSFRKQLSKQKQKYENMMAEQNKAFEEMKSRLEKLENPEKYKNKLRNDFETDDQYIDYIVQQRMQKFFDEENQKNAKLKEEEAAELEHQEAINTNIVNCFKTEAEQKDYYTVVKNAFDHGLEALMDKEGMVAEYIMKSANGPKILYELAKDPNKVKQIYGQMDPQSRFFELKMLEREILSRPVEPVAPAVAPAPVQQNPNLAKPVGTPGLAKGNTKDMFEDKDDLRAFLRRR